VVGLPCRDLLDWISQQGISGFTSTHVLTNVAHRLMTMEAPDQHGWPMNGIAYRLKRHPPELQTLTRFRQSVEEVPNFGLQVLDVELPHVLSAGALSQQHGLLSGDALFEVTAGQTALTPTRAG